MKILFVCLGNICRSPAAEGIFTQLVECAGLSERIRIDSAGTSAAHVGEPADPRMQRHANRRGYALRSRSRQITSEDLDRFDILIPMDPSTVRKLQTMASSSQQRNRIRPMVAFCQSPAHPGYVPDPYYGGEQGFELVLDILEDATQGLLQELQASRLL